MFNRVVIICINQTRKHSKEIYEIFFIFLSKLKKPEKDHDGWTWMLHGDMGEDNTKHLVLNKEDAAEG